MQTLTIDGFVAPAVTEKSVNEFARKSLSPHTRRAYARVVREFFAALGHQDPARVTPAEVIAWRDRLIARKQRAHTVATKIVPPPPPPEDLAGRALTRKEALRLLAGPNQDAPEGARDYALLLMGLRLSLRVSELCSLRASSMKFSRGRWIIKFTVKGGRERTLPLPEDVRAAVVRYLTLDANRRKTLKSDGPAAYLFQPFVNYRTLVHDKPLSTRMAYNIVARWGDYAGLGKLSPHDLRRTAITQALDQGLSYRQVQMMSGHKDPKTVMKYDHGRENLDQNAVNFLKY
jgi:integrase/recombinase XerD